MNNSVDDTASLEEAETRPSKEVETDNTIIFPGEKWWKKGCKILSFQMRALSTI